MNRLFILFTMMLVLLVSCESKEDKQAKIDRQKILDYLKEHNLEALERPSGLFYIIDNPGTGEHPSANSVVTVRYTGYYLNGTVFDTNEGGAANPFDLRGVIAGWREGIPLFKKGGSGKLLIPSGLAYGVNSLHFYGIPNNSVLIFDIRLLDFY